MARILVLGGTSFVGRHFVEAALDGGHDLTLFNRGRTNAELFPDVEKRQGDRSASDLETLREGEWDAVVDVNGYVPRVVREACDLLRGRVGTYCFISTGSVYADLTAAVIGEDSPVAGLADPETEEVTGETYGGLKVLCERAAQEAFPGSALVVRPGIVAGPHDPTERFTYWVRRLARGGRVLGPPRPDQPVQVVHARDQGEFILSLLTAGRAGVYNSVGPDEPLTFAGLVEACAEAGGSEAEVVWKDAEFLRTHEVQLPLVLPADGAMDGIFRIDNARARVAGLRNRSIVETAVDTLHWDRGREQGDLPGVPTAEREAEVLDLD